MEPENRWLNKGGNGQLYLFSISQLWKSFDVFQHVFFLTKVS